MDHATALNFVASRLASHTFRALRERPLAGTPYDLDHVKVTHQINREACEALSPQCRNDYDSTLDLLCRANKATHPNDLIAL